MPYYWNIAPNRDATFTPKLMMHRGIDLGLSFVTWNPRSAVWRAAITPGDRLTDTDRWGFSLAPGNQKQPPSACCAWDSTSIVSAATTTTGATTFNGTSANATTFAGAAITQRLLPNDAFARVEPGTVLQHPGACCAGRPCGTLGTYRPALRP